MGIERFFGFLRGKQEKTPVREPSAGETRPRIQMALSSAERAKLLPRWRFDHDRDVETYDEYIDFKRTLEPHVAKISSLMLDLYGPSVLENQPIPIKLKPMPETFRGVDLRGAGMAEHHYINVGNYSTQEGHFPIQKGYSSLCKELRMFGKNWDTDKHLAEMMTHELGHPLLGPAFPNHWGLQEAVAECNRFVLCARNPELMGTHGSYRQTSVQPMPHNILAGQGGWGIPEHAHLNLLGNGAALTSLLYPIQSGALFRAMGSSLDNFIPLVQTTLKNWKESVKMSHEIQRQFPMPTIAEWMQNADQVIPGFSKRFEEEHLYQREHVLPVGERISWHPLDWGGYLAVLRYTQNPDFLDIKGDAQKQIPGMISAKDMNTLCGTMETVDARVVMKFPPSDEYFDGPIDGILTVDATLVHNIAQQLGVVLTPGATVLLEITGKEHSAQQSLIWNEQAERLRDIIASPPRDTPFPD